MATQRPVKILDLPADIVVKSKGFSLDIGKVIVLLLPLLNNGYILCLTLIVEYLNINRVRHVVRCGMHFTVRLFLKSIAVQTEVDRS